jgi:hypothetical protein
MATWGVVKQAFDTFKYNRDLLGKKKSAREIFREEIERRGTNLGKVKLADLKERVAARLKTQRAEEIRTKAKAIIFTSLLLMGISWFVVSASSWSSATKQEPTDPSKLFSSHYDVLPDSSVMKTDYYPGATKAARTILQKGLRQQRSVSYYESGERFRSALYYNDTLIAETYFYKSGDTIRRFPEIRDNKVHKITLTDPTGATAITFHFYDGKMIRDTYVETPARPN